MDDNLPSGVGGAGSGYYHPLSCGIQHPMTWEKRNAGISNFFNPLSVDGYIRINGNNVWHTLADDPMAIPIGTIDLYSLVLHEAVHALGFNSFITDDGTPLFESIDNDGNTTFGFYTAYDKLLYSDSELDYLISEKQNPVPEYCCDEHEFNPGVDIGVLPFSSGGCGDLLFDQQVNAPVNQLFVAGTSTFNSLSHLDENCNSSVDYFVMHYGSPSGPESERRELQAEELEILCKIGMRDNCDDGDCMVVASDDIIIYESDFNNSIYSVPISFLLVNDFLSGPGSINADDIEIIPDCGNVTIGSVDIIGENLVLTDLPYGTFKICYNLTYFDSPCSGACDQAFIFIQHNVAPILPMLSPCPDVGCNENLFCHGDFNDLLPIPAQVFNSTDTEVPYFMQMGYPLCLQTNTTTNTPDVFFLGGNERAIRLSSGGANNESIYFPLTTGLQPGCSATISFKAANRNNNLSNLFFFGSKEHPCTIGLLPGSCMNTTEFLCMNEDLLPMEVTGSYSPLNETQVPCGDSDYPLSMDWCSVVPNITRYDDMIDNFQTFSYIWENTSDTPINFVSITSLPVNSSGASAVIDNISLIPICENELTLELLSSPSDICLNGTVELEYELCFEGEGTSPVTIVLEPSTLPTGFNTTFGGDFSSGVFEIELMPLTMEVCTTLVLSVTLNPGNVPPVPGDELEILMDVLAPGTCVNGNSDLSVNLGIEYGEGIDAMFDIIPLSVDCPSYNFNSLAINTSLSHFWDFGDDIGSSAEPNPTYNYLDNGSFTVSHTVSNNCGSSTEEQIITVDIEIPDASFSPTIISGCEYQFTPISTEGDHHWEFGNGEMSDDVNPPPVTYPGIGGEFTIIHTVTNECGGEDIEELVITPSCQLSCDCPSNSIFLSSQQTSLNELVNVSGILPANPTAPVNIVIKTELNIDIPVPYYQFSYEFPPGSTICMEKDASINIEQAAGLLLNGVIVKGANCDALWRDITVETGGRLEITNYSTIQDGLWGVTLSPNCRIGIANTTFNKNFIGLTIPPNVTILEGGINSFNFNNNWFTANGNLLPPGDITPPAGIDAPSPGTASWAGIYSRHSGVFRVWQNNRFSEITNGIVYEGDQKPGSLWVRESSFTNIVADQTNTSYNGFARGNGIFIERGMRFIVEGFGQNGDPSFENCTVGIHCAFNRGGNDIKDNNMVGMRRRGVEAIANFPAFVYVRSNNIDSELDGIFTSYMQFGVNQSGLSGLDISDNDISAGAEGNGIILSNITALPVSLVGNNVFNNTISVKGGSNPSGGIYMLNVDGLSVNNNSVQMGFSDMEAFGIRLENCRDNDLSCNTVAGGGASLTNQIGIMAEESQMNRYSCNATTNLGLGVEFLGMCDGSNFRGNMFMDNETGLRYSNVGDPSDPVSAITGVQKWRSNEWLSNSGNPGAVNEGGAPEILLSQYLIQDEDFETPEFWPTNPLFSPDWFIYEDEGTNPPDPVFACPASLNNCNISIDGLNEPGPCEDLLFESTIANGVLNGGIYQPGWTWMKEKYLYRNIKEECLGLLSVPEFQLFYSNNQGSNIGQFYEVEKGVRAFFDLDGISEQAIIDFELQFDGLLAALHLVDIELITASPSEVPGLLVQKDSLLLEIVNLADSHDNLLDGIQVQQANNASQLSTDNGTLTGVQLFETNEQDVNDIFFNTLALGHADFSQNELTVLQTVANQCPYAGGSTVFKARGLLGLDDFQVYDDKSLCQVNGGQQQRPVEPAVQLVAEAIRLFPNPAKHSFSLQFAAREKEGALMVTDLYGRQVYGATVPPMATALTVQTKDWAAGTYFVRLVFDGDDTLSETLTIIKD